jgi:nucleotide-binding universal stress UspA family protein
MLMKALLAFDGSDYAERASRCLIRMMKENPALDATVISVAELDENLVNLLPQGKVLADIQEVCNLRAAGMVEKAVSLFKEAGLDVVPVVRQGDPSRVIAEFAAREKFELIVMGKHGMNDFKGILIGSVTRQVVSLSGCPVMIVK